MIKIFETKDRTNRIIYLSEERWKHIVQQHEEMHDLLSIERIKDTLLNPNIIISDNYDLNKKFYFRYYKDKREYLFISVKYLNGKGFIITSFYTDKIKWKKK